MPVAPVASELDAIATDLKAAGALSVKTVAKDLARPESPQEIFDELLRERIYVDILVNNAGTAHRGKAWEIPIADDILIVRLNVEAVLRLTKLFLPGTDRWASIEFHRHARRSGPTLSGSRRA